MVDIHKWILNSNSSIPRPFTGIILCMHPANERQHYNVTPSLIGWAKTQNDLCLCPASLHHQGISCCIAHIGFCHHWGKFSTTCAIWKWTNYKKKVQMHFWHFLRKNPVYQELICSSVEHSILSYTPFWDVIFHNLQHILSNSSHTLNEILIVNLINILRPWENGQYFAEDILIFFCNKIVFWFKFHWNLLPMVLLLLN